MNFRLKCFGYHLLISTFIALLCLYTVFYLWYPSPLDKALDVTSIFLMLISIDVVVGPLLTLLVAKQGKKTLKMDLLVIGLIQVLALGYGIYTVAKGRPIWLVYSYSGRFEVVQAYEVDSSGAEKEMSQSWIGPQWAELVENIPGDVLLSEAYLNARYLEPFNSVKKRRDISTHAYPVTVLSRFNNAEKVEQLLAKYPEANAFVPMISKRAAISVVINKDVGAPIAVVDLSPW